ncbi:Hpt domain-containing protein [Verrucomicrobium sp. GAS474]|uniref:response regulator n=1 Tax=Verrucomicrobium sp. GAS474 TaxID=1882831 RepID=UPI00087B9604|nr:response regulator [Verrucomicrobium sp. GAS474]SDU04560.1 Hpt domain-containing protein [Verrucomicrobium sp. GAS474]
MPTPSPRPAILIVDGNALNRRLAEQFLLQLGCRCGLVPSGAEALQAVVREKWDAVLIELTLPDQSGMEMARRLRKQVDEAGYPLPRLVALADGGSPRTRVLCRLAGIREFLLRPLTLPGLETALALKPGAAAAGRTCDPVLLQTLEGLRDMAGKKFVFDLIEILAREGPERLAEIGGMLATGNLPVAGRLFHKMKGSASSFGAVELNRICEVGDDACAEGNAALARDCHRLAGEELGELAVMLKQWKEGETE